MNYTNRTNLLDDNLIYEVEWHILIILSILYGIISILAVFGNGLIIGVVIRSRHMHNVTNYFICNLALADIVIGIFAVPFQFQAALLQYWILPKIMCKLAPFATTLSLNISIFTLVAISIDRYHVILYPLKQKLSNKQCYIILVIIWIIAFLLSIIHLFNYKVNIDEELLVPRCELANRFLFKYHSIFLIIVQYILPFVIILYTYLRIGLSLYYAKLPQTVDNKQDINKKKVIKMIFIVVLLFMICWTPIQIYNFLDCIQPSINDYKYINIIWFFANWFAMSNSCYNVFIYGICSARFKREFKRVFRYLTCSKTQESSPNLSRRYTTFSTTLIQRTRTMSEKFASIDLNGFEEKITMI